MDAPAPFDRPVTACVRHGQPCDLVHEIGRGVRGQFPEATPAEVAHEVRLRLDRLRRAWQAWVGVSRSD